MSRIEIKMKVISYMMLYVIMNVFYHYSNGKVAAESFSLITADNSDKIERIIQQIPEDDLNEIKHLFEYLFKYNGLGFTLFMDKPVSFCPIDSFLFHLSGNLYGCTEKTLLLNKNFHKEWRTWKKHESSFHLKKYVFMLDKLGVVLINKQSLEKCFSDNKKRIIKILGPEFNVNLFLKKIEENNGLVKLMNRDHEFLGIILGFGVHNSQLFQRREDILNVLEPDTIPVYLNKTITPSLGYATTEEELSDLWTKLDSLNPSDQYFPIVNLNRVGFAVDPKHKETIFLRKKYEIQRQKINEILAREDWFKQILMSLSADPAQSGLDGKSGKTSY
jgi:hypothetical protein